MTNKFIGEMTYDEFIDALWIIIRAEDSEKDKRTFKEKCIGFFKDIANDFKYIFSKQPFIDTKNFFIKTVNVIKNFKLQTYIEKFKNFLNDLFENKKEQLTKERFIEKGIKFKFILQEIVETVIFVVIAVIVIRFYLAEVRWIPSGSMRPTLLEGDRIIVERYSRFHKTPERGDIMVFYPPFTELKNTPVAIFKRLTGFFCDDVAYIKRVIALPGEKFEIKRDKKGAYAVYINDKPLDEPYIYSKYEFTPCTDPRVNCGPTIVPEHHYMMMGDNRAHSLDGRFWGTLHESQFIGRATFRFWPHNRIKSISK